MMVERICCPLEGSEAGNGGIKWAGKGSVSIAGDVWDGFAAVWPLDEDFQGYPEEEEGDGTEGKFFDRTRFHLDGTGGDGVDPTQVPTIDLGVFCQPSQHFDGRQSIQFEPDSLVVSQDFSVSLWAKIETFFVPRTFFDRGAVFFIGHTFLNQITAGITVLTDQGSEKTYEAVGSTQLDQNHWYHLAATFEPGIGLKLYVDGVLDGSLSITERESIGVPDANYASLRNGASWIEGNLQDIRLHGESRNAAWFLAEHDNYCDSGFFTVSEEMDVTSS